MSTEDEDRRLDFKATVECLEKCAHMSMTDPEGAMEWISGELDVACRLHRITWLRDVIFMEAARNYAAQARAARRAANKAIRSAKCT